MSAQLVNQGQHRREVGELKTQDSSQRHSSARGGHRSVRGPPGDEENRSESIAKPDGTGGGPHSGLPYAALNDTLLGNDRNFSSTDADYPHGLRYTILHARKPDPDDLNPGINEWDRHISSAADANLPRPIIPETKVERGYKMDRVAYAQGSMDDAYVEYFPRDVILSNSAHAPAQGAPYHNDALYWEMPDPAEGERPGALLSEQYPDVTAYSAYSRQANLPPCSTTSPYGKHRQQNGYFKAAACAASSTPYCTDDHDIRQHPNDLDERRHSLEQRHLYEECMWREAPNKSGTISFGEGVPGQGYSERTHVTPEITHFSSRRSRSTPAPFERRQTPKRCLIRDCPFEGKPRKDGFCLKHFQQFQVRQVEGQPDKDAFDKRENSTGMRTPLARNPLIMPTQGTKRPVTQMQAHKQSPGSGHRADLCKAPNCRTPKDPELDGLCNNCHDYYSVASNPQLMKDYEVIVGNIMAVSAAAKQKCRTEDCDNFGNHKSQWYCNQCNFRAHQTGSSGESAPTGPASPNQDMHGSTELKYPAPSCQTRYFEPPKSRGDGRSGIPEGSPAEAVCPEASSAEGVRQLMGKPRYKCRNPACSHFASELCGGYCNSCFQP